MTYYNDLDKTSNAKVVLYGKLLDDSFLTDICDYFTYTDPETEEQTTITWGEKFPLRHEISIGEDENRQVLGTCIVFSSNGYPQPINWVDSQLKDNSKVQLITSDEVFLLENPTYYRINLLRPCTDIFEWPGHVNFNTDLYQCLYWETSGSVKTGYEDEQLTTPIVQETFLSGSVNYSKIEWYLGDGSLSKNFKYTR